MNSAAAVAAGFATLRLRAQPLAERDEDLYCTLYTDAELMRYVGTPLQPAAAQRSFRAALAAAAKARPVHLYLSLCPQDGGDAVGVCALRDIDATSERAELGLMLRRQTQAQGFACEALSGLIAWGFRRLPVQQLYSLTDPANLRARRLAVRAGMTYQPHPAAGPAEGSCLFVVYRPDVQPSSTTCH
jgi:ribosomal-protein-alanine N-acetyltransferase